MPAVSKAQRQFMAICEHSPKHAQGQCPNMTHEQMHHFAATPEKGLPQYKKPKRGLGNVRVGGMK